MNYICHANQYLNMFGSHKVIYLYFTLIVSLFAGCNKTTTSNKNDKKTTTILKEENKPDQQLKQNETVEIEVDSINSKNVVSFLTEYGKQNKENQVLIKTRLGNIKVKLFDDTPLHRANFIFLSKIGYFDTTCFYRVVPDFIIQGGNSENMNTLAYRNKYKHYKLPAEFISKRKHKYGALAAARDWENNPHKKSTAFEFYIVQNKKGAHHLDGEHTVFGEVISGFKVIDKIVNLNAGGDEWPYEDVFIEVSVIK